MGGLRCSQCGAADLPAESRFCLRCGAPLASAFPAPPASYTPPHLSRVLARRSAREGERKEVTVLVADVAGSLAMAHRLDPEDMHALMDGFFALALDAVHAECGTLNQFRGDGFMALFGAPAARPHHAREGVRAALAIRRAAEAYSRSVRARFGVPLALRMGVHSGPVWVGSIGTDLRRDYTAEGPTVGIAVRLEQSAGPGQILVSADTARRVAGAFTLRPAGARTLRGTPQPVEAYEVVAEAADEEAIALSEGAGDVPFTGRAAEIARGLQRLEAVGAGEAACVEIIGEPGVGKSRLALEMRLRTAGPWLSGRCRESSVGRAYDAWLSILRHWPGEPAACARAAAVAALLEGRDGPHDPPACEAALRALLDEQPRGGAPLALHLEDVHWIDGSSRRLLLALLARPPARGLRVLLTARRERALTVPDALAIPLGALEPEHAHALALAALAACPDPEPLAAFAAARGGGNPLYVLEVARALCEGGDELRDAARLEVSWRRSRWQLPETLTGVIAARLDALPDGAKRMLQTASIFGRAFTASELARLAEEDETETRACIEELMARSMLVRAGEELDFQHALHRDVAYEQMLRTRRRELHRRCALLLEREPGPPAPERASEIGRHYDEAGEGRRAAEALLDAGEGYLGLLAAREAAGHLRRAWELTREVAAPGLRLRAALALARALNTLDRAGEASAVLDGVESEALAPEDRARLAHAWIESGWIRFAEHGDADAALGLLERGLALAHRIGGDRDLESRAHAYRIRVCHLDGSIAAAAQSARRLTELATAEGSRIGLVLGLGNEGYVRCDAGEVQRGLELCEEARALADEARHDVGGALAAGWLAKAYAYRGECEAAIRVAERARELGRRTGQASAVYNAELWTGLAYLLMDEPKRAAEVLERIAEINDRWPTTLDWLAVARLETRRLDEAARLARRCLARRPPRLVRVRALRTLGLALGLAPDGDREGAEQLLEQSLALAQDLNLAPHVAETHFAIAELCRLAEDEHRAAYYTERAIQQWEACGMPLHAARARATL